MLGTASAALVSACGAAFGEEPGLGHIAASKGLLFGSLIRLSSPGVKASYVETDAAYARMVTRECGLYVSTGVFWARIAPTPMVTNFSLADPLAPGRAPTAWPSEAFL